MRRLETPMLYVLTADETVFRHVGALGSRWHAHRLGQPAELDSLPAGSLVLVDSAHPQRPDWQDPRWRKWSGHFSLIIASSAPNDDEGLAAMEAGASGYCHAYANEATLKQVLEVVSSGELWVGRNLLTRLLRGVTQGATDKAPPISWQTPLTAREIEVARRAALGESNLAIAEALGITERTVKAHLTAIFEKLQVADRLQLALKVHGVK